MADRGWLLAATHNRKRAFANCDQAMDVDPRGLPSPRDLRSTSRVPRSPSTQNPGAYIVHETVGVYGGLDGVGDQGDHTRPRSVRCAPPKIKERRSAYEHAEKHRH